VKNSDVHALFISWRTSSSGLSLHCLQCYRAQSNCTDHTSHSSVSVVRTTFKVYRKSQNLTLSQPKIPEQIVTKFEQRDYVGDLYHQNKFGLNPPRGFCSPYRWNIHPSRVRMFTFLVLPHAYRLSPLDRFLRLIRQTTRFCARKCLFNVTK